MTAIDRRDDFKRKKIIEVSKAILGSMKYQRLLNKERKNNVMDEEKSSVRKGVFNENKIDNN